MKSKFLKNEKGKIEIMKISKLCGLLLFVAVVMPSEGHSGGGLGIGRKLAQQFPTVCRIKNAPGVKGGLDLSGVMLSPRHVLTSGIMDRI